MARAKDGGQQLHGRLYLAGIDAFVQYGAGENSKKNELFVVSICQNSSKKLALNQVVWIEMSAKLQKVKNSTNFQPIIASGSSMLELKAPISIAGDIHGQVSE